MASSHELKPRDTILTVLAGHAIRHSPPTLRLLGIGSGLVALAAVLLGAGSWILLGSMFVIWCYAGWAIFFGERARIAPAMLAAEYVLVASGLIVALGVLTGLYLIALGPSWVP